MHGFIPPISGWFGAYHINWFVRIEPRHCSCFSPIISMYSRIWIICIISLVIYIYILCPQINWALRPYHWDRDTLGYTTIVGLLPMMISFPGSYIQYWHMFIPVTYLPYIIYHHIPSEYSWIGAFHCGTGASNFRPRCGGGQVASSGGSFWRKLPSCGCFNLSP